MKSVINAFTAVGSSLNCRATALVTISLNLNINISKFEFKQPNNICRGRDGSVGIATR
jgi:hypothetical protein